MNVEQDNSAKQSPMLSSTYKLAPKLQSDLNPLFSISSAHSCAVSGLTFLFNSIVFYRLRTSRDDYGGWGCPALSATALPIRVNPCPSAASFSAPATSVFSASYKRVRNILKTSTFKSLYFHTHVHSFLVSPLFASLTQNNGGVYPETVRFWDFRPIHHSLAAPGCGLYLEPAKSKAGLYLQPAQIKSWGWATSVSCEFRPGRKGGPMVFLASLPPCLRASFPGRCYDAAACIPRAERN